MTQRAVYFPRYTGTAPAAISGSSTIRLRAGDSLELEICPQGEAVLSGWFQKSQTPQLSSKCTENLEKKSPKF